MSFLNKTPGMTPREAREVCQLHELIEESRARGSVPLDLYVQVWRVESKDVENQERNARRLVARLKALGFRVVAEGDKKTLALNFSEDEALRAEVERWVDMAREVRTEGDGFVDDEDEAAQNVSQRIPTEVLHAEHELGMGIRSLCRRYRIEPARVQSILRALHAEHGTHPHDEGRPPVERRRSLVVIAEALELGKTKGLGESRKNGRVAAVARLLGCHRDTARAFLKRYDALRRPPSTPK